MQSIHPLFLLTLMIFTTSVCANEWKQVKNSNNVQIFSKKHDDGHAEVKAVTRIAAHPHALLHLLDDTVHAPNWISNCKRVETIDWFGAKERTVHAYFNAPWPFTDRDMITFSTTHIDKQNKTVTIDIIDKGQQYSLLHQYVRMENVKGKWTVTSIDEQTIEITYQGTGSAAGSIPNWIANKVLLNSTHETFVNMRQLIIQAKYQKPLESKP